MTRIVTPPSKDDDKNNPTRVTEVFIYRKDHKLDFAHGHLPSSYMFDGLIPVEFRPYRSIIVVSLNVNDAIFDPSYRAAVRKLLGWRFGGLVCRRIRSHRRWNGGRDMPLMNPRATKRIVDHILAGAAKTDESLELVMRPSDASSQLATS